MERNIPKTTYNDILNQVKTWITSNCRNITDFAGLSNHYKTGTVINISNITSNHNHGTASHKLTVNNGVVQKTATDVENDLNTFFTNLGLPSSKRNYPIDDSNFYNFLYNISLFCSYKICLASSQIVSPASGNGTFTSGLTSATNRCIVYSTATVSGGNMLYPQPENATDSEIIINGLVTGKSLRHTINQTDMKKMVDCILNNRLARKVIPIKYTYSITSD